MEAFEFSVHFMHGFIALLTCVALLPMILTTLLSNTFAKQLQKNLIYLLILNIIWNVLAFVEQLPRVYISDDVRYVIYILGSICWVQYGYAVFRVICGIAGENINPAWKKLGFFLTIWNIFAVLFCLITGFTGHFYTGIISTWYGFTATNSNLANVAILLFLIIPMFLSSIVTYQLMKRTNAEKIFRSIFVAQITSIIAGFTMDAILPAMGLFIYGESASIFLFLITFVLFRATAALAQTGLDMSKSLKSVIQELEEGILILNSNGRIEFSNHAVNTMFGVGEKGLFQKPITQFIPDLTSLNPMNNVPIYLKNNSVSAAITITPLISHGILFGYKVILRDLRKTDDTQMRFSRLQAEFNDERDAIRLRIVNLQKLYLQQQIFLNSLLNNLPSRLWAKNLNGAYTQQNKKDIEIRGNLKSHIEDPIFTEQELQAMESPGRIVVKNETTQDENGKKHWEKHTAIPLYDEAKRVKGVLGLIEDTTDFHALEDERNQLRENLVKASTFEDMSNVAGGLAHDFNNLLAGIIGYRDLAEATLPKSEDCTRTQKYLANMQKSLTNATELVKRTYDQLKERQGNHANKSSNFNVGLVFDEVRNALSATLPSNIKILKNSSDDMIAFGNQTDFHRIMLNMGKNAILAMKSGGTLTYGCRKTHVAQQIVTQFSTIPAGDYLYITIKDTGDGMTPDVVKHIFTPYFTTRAPGQGMGIGLSVAMRLIKDAGAHLNLETTIGKGTKFILYWPIAKKLEDETNA